VLLPLPCVRKWLSKGLSRRKIRILKALQRNPPGLTVRLLVREALVWPDIYTYLHELERKKLIEKTDSPKPVSRGRREHYEAVPVCYRITEEGFRYLLRRGVITD